MILMPYGAVLPRLAAAEGLFLFGVKKKQNRGIAELINTNKNNRKPLIKCRLKIYSFVVYKFSCIHEGFAVFFRSQWDGFVSGARKIC